MPKPLSNERLAEIRQMLADVDRWRALMAEANPEQFPPDRPYPPAFIAVRDLLGEVERRRDQFEQAEVAHAGERQHLYQGINQFKDEVQKLRADAAMRDELDAARIRASVKHDQADQALRDELDARTAEVKRLRAENATLASKINRYHDTQKPPRQG